MQNAAKKVALTAVLAALLIGGKWALAALPNIEVVTILIASFAFVFGFFVSLTATIVFVLEETLSWGFHTWAISYFIYWPLVALVFSILGMAMKKPSTWVFTITAVGLTIFFGFLTSLVQVGLFSGRFERFWIRFWLVYSSGFLFYALHIACNLTLFFGASKPLVMLLKKLKRNFFGEDPPTYTNT